MAKKGTKKPAKPLALGKTPKLQKVLSKAGAGKATFNPF